MISFKRYNTTVLVFFLFAIALLFYRCWLLFEFGFKYTDSDQSIMWLGTRDYSEGNFYEPRFYGQSYNSMLESLLAVPLYKLGVPLHKALPIITTFLTLVPYFILAGITFKKKSQTTAIVLLTIPFFLSPNYDLITCLSRGFVTGIAVSSVALVALYRTEGKLIFLISGLFMVIGYSVNPNSILLSLPCLLFIFLNNLKNKNFYRYQSIGIVIGVIIHLWISSFYTTHPKNVVHGMEMEYSWTYLKEGISHLDRYFNDLTPFLWNNGWLVIAIPLIFTAFFYLKKQFKFALVALSMPFLFLLIFGVSKVHDGVDSIFFSYSRMFLAVPILFVLLVSFITIRSKAIVTFVLCLMVVFFWKKVEIVDQMEKNITEQGYVVSALKTNYLYNECAEIKQISLLHKIDLIIINDHNLYDFYNYGCPACMDFFPKTIRPLNERRTWRLVEDQNHVYKNILLIDLQKKHSKSDTLIEALSCKEGFYVIKLNTLTTAKLFKKLGIKSRPF